MQSRDRRFEGRFVAGVLTTRIYCRPGCPARMPNRKNVRFFACAAAAEEHGLRPCLRCRPDASAASPRALGAPATVARALGLIAEGHTADLDELAARVGVGSRHLRRLFQDHLGASPGAVARTQRLHFARKLLEETHLPVTDVAFASGFRSLRRFHDAFRRSFHAPPSALRRAPRAEEDDATLALRLVYRPPLAWLDLLAFLGARATPGVEAVFGEAYRRTFASGGAMGVLEVRPVAPPRRPRGVITEGALALAVHTAPGRPLFGLVRRVRALFDLDADPSAIAAVLRRDRALAPLVARRPGLRVPGAFDGFEVAVRAILGQQVSVAGATTLAGRLAAAYGERVRTQLPGLTRLFPTPERLARADIESIGVPAGRAEAIRALARATLGGLALSPGAGDDAVRALLEIRGVGPWTAAYVAMRALGAPDAFPEGDLGLKRALGVRDIVARAERWRPWRAYAAMHLWAHDSKERTAA
jgi:AraC family transcriptional regulator of adaptative response / DNA-3-methyladenine glycosylase II